MNTAANFEQTVLPHLDAAHDLARWLVRDASLAQDVVQESALRALGFFAGYRGGDSRAWFLRIVRNVAMTALAKRGRLPTISLDDAGPDQDGMPTTLAVPDDSRNPEQILGHAESTAALDRALAALPIELRECLVLRELEECSYRDIAHITGLPTGTVMSRLWRARKMLARMIDQGARP